MNNTTFAPWAAVLASLAFHSSGFAQSVDIAVADDGLHTRLGAGTNPIANKDGLQPNSYYTADPLDDSGLIMGLGNAQERMGMFWWVYSDIVSPSSLPSTIQAGAYRLKLSVAGSSIPFASPVGGIDLTGADVTPNTDPGLIAGFFSTFENETTGATAAARANAEASKDHMYTEFNSLTGVTYTAPTEVAPPNGTGTTDSGEGWTTWTFTWNIAPGSPVIGTDPNFAIYTKVDGITNAGAWYDDSKLEYSANSIFPTVTSFSADSTEVGPGDSVTLSWTTSDATTAILDPGGDPVALSGNSVVNPTETTTYTLTASDGVTSDSQSIEIVVGPRINSFTADFLTVGSDDPVILSWDVDNATSLILDPNGIVVTGETSYTVNPSATTTYTLTASDGSTNVMETIEIAVIPEIVAFSADETAVGTGDPVTLSWTVEDATDLSLDPGNLDVTGLTSTVVNPTETTTYTLFADDGVTTVQADVVVTVGPVIDSFTSDLAYAVSGAPVTLTWSADKFTTLDLYPDNVDVTEQTSYVVNPTETTTYELFADDETNFASALLTVVVVPAPPSIPSGPTISVNFHTDDVDAPADHQVTAGEIAGFVPVDGAFWTNISGGTPAAHNTAESIFESTQLIDDTGNADAATIAPSIDSTYFLGYAASSAAEAQELMLPGNDDDLFNSYLALNGPSGDGSPADAAVLNISNLGTAYTSEGYTLIIYSDSDRRNTGTNTRQSLFTLTPNGGSPVTALTEDDDAAPGVNIFDNTYVFSDYVDDGDDYSNFVIFEGLTSDSFTLEITSPDGGRGAISGFQIVGGTGLPVAPLQLNITANGANLDFDWNSLAGMSYNLRASTSLDTDPLTWPIVLGQGDIPETAPTNTLSIARPMDSKTFYVVEEFPTP